MDAIPEPFASALDEVAVVVEEHAARTVRPLRPLHRRAAHRGRPALGDAAARITVYVHPLVDHFPERAAMVEQVRITVLHELGHHLGFDEDRLEELGYG